MLSDPNITVNRSPHGCVVVYWATLSYGLHFRLHIVILKILNKYELVIA